ncbi:hypothetical protein HZ326_3693 [Fusarium oxysporum f. sp. albedinis]|jgi:hypothetical protein|nr:hypothetical protein HZ326_3693 [Fusarium oxysporum f. sp. albedinis]
MVCVSHAQIDFETKFTFESLYKQDWTRRGWSTSIMLPPHPPPKCLLLLDSTVSGKVITMSLAGQSTMRWERVDGVANNLSYLGCRKAPKP